MRDTRTMRTAALGLTLALSQALSSGAAEETLAAAPRIELTPFATAIEATPPPPPPAIFPVQLMLDDDGAEGAIGVTVGAAARQFLWFNRFTRPPGVDLVWLDEIWVLFPQSPEIAVGAPVQLAVYLDPDGNPANGANLLATYPAAVQAADGNTFSIYPIPSLAVSGAGDILIGVVDRFVVGGVTPPTSSAALDTTASQGRSWIAVWSADPPASPTLPPDALLTRTDDLGFPGNFMIRGFGRLPSVVEVPTLDTFGLAGLGLLLAGAAFALLRRRCGGPTAAIVVALLATGGIASAQPLVDDFATTPGPAVAVPGSSAATVAGAGMLGGERDLVVSQVSGSGVVQASVSSPVGLAFSAPAGTRGQLLVAWDGTDGNATAVAPAGLGTIDLTSGGRSAFRLAVTAVRAGTEIEIRVYSGGGTDISRLARALPETVAPRDFFFDFSDFTVDQGSGATFNAVGAITLRVTGTDAVVEGSTPASFTATRFETAAPAMSALKVDLSTAGAPLASASPGDTVRYRITLTNTGATAQAVNLADALDPNLALVAGSLRTTPVARPDAYKTLPNTTLDSGAAGRPSLLANDGDADGNAVAAVAAAGQPTLQGGTVSIGANGHFVYVPPAGFTGPDSFSYTLQATAGDPTADTSGAPLAPVSSSATVVVERIPPTLAPGGPVTFTEDAGPVILAAGLTVSAPDSPTLSSATVTITNLLDVGVETLAANTAGTAITAVYLAPTLTLSGSDTIANYQQVLRSVSYDNSSEDPSTTARSLDWIAVDPFGPGSTATSTVNVVAVPDVPVVTTTVGTTGFTEDGGAVVVDSGVTVTDADSANLASATVTVTNPQDGAAEVLAATSCAGLTVTPGLNTLGITGSATVAVYQTCLQSVTYLNSSQNPGTTTRVISFVANDGTSASTAASKSVSVTAVPDPPVVTTTAGTTGFTEDGGAVVVDSGVTVTDADSANLASATVTVTNPQDGAAEALAATSCAGLTVTPGLNTLGIAGSATVAVYQTCLQSVTYINSSQNPGTTARVISFFANDGAASSAPANKSVSVTAVPDPPVVTTTAGTTGFTEDGGAVVGDSGVTVTDADSANLASATVTVTNPQDGAAEVLAATSCAGLTVTPGLNTLGIAGSATVAVYQACLQSVTYLNSSQNPGTTTRVISFVANDGSTASAVANKSVSVTAVNDAPVVTTTGGVTAFVEDAGAVAIDSALTVADVDNTNLASATVTITNPQDGALEVLAATSCAGLTVTPGLNTLGIAGSATVAVYQTCLQSVTYNNSSQNPNATTRSLSFVASDGTDASATANKSVSVTPVNDPPTITTTPVSYSTPGNTQLHVEGKVLPGVVAVTDASGVDAKAGPFTDPDGPVAPAIVDAAGASANGGSYDIDPDGSFTYVPPAGFTGTDSFTYQVTDTLDPVVGTVNVSVGQRVWYIRDVVDANNAAGGDGRSTNAFDTIAAFNAATTNDSDVIFVFRGDTGTTPLGGGITLKNGQKLWGEGIGLTLPSFGTLVPAGSKPVIGNTTAGGNGVTILANTANGNRTDVEVRGLSLSGNTNAVDVTAANAANVAVTISDNDVTGAGVEGIDLNAGSTGTFTATLGNNALAATGNAFDARTSAATTMTLAFSDNAAVSSGPGTVAIYVEGATGGGTTRITGFANNAVNGTSAGAGISVTGATFDATPGGAYQTVSGGTTVIGASGSGNGVGGAGLALTSIAGDLAFTDLDVFADGGAAVRITGTGAVNTGAGIGTRVTVGAGVAIFEATGGPAVDVNGATVDLQPTSLKSTNSPAMGVSLVNVADGTTPATFSASSGSSITNATGTAFNVDGGNATITYPGTITNSAGRSVSVTNRTADSVTLSGAITDTGTGIFLNANTGSTIAFSGTLSLTTGSNDAFTATGGGTVSTTDTASTITTTTGRAINVANTTIGAGGLRFRSVSAGTAASGPTSGIVLNNTGSTAGLTVSGADSAGSGGTIRRAGTGISLTSTQSPSFSWMQLNDFTDFAIRGSSVSGFSLTNSVINGVNGDNAAADEGSVRFTGLTGSATISDTSISGGFEDNFKLINTTGNLNRITFSNVTIGANSTTDGNDGIGIESTGAATVVNVTVQNSFFTSSRGDLFQLNVLGNSTADLVFTGNTLSNNHPGIATGGGGVTISGGDNTGTGANLTMNMSNNTFRDADGHAVLFVKSTDPGTFRGTFSGNQVGVAATADSGSKAGSGIKVQNAGLGTVTVAVTGNTIRQYNNFGIELVTGGGASALSGALNATVTGNTVANPGTGGLPMNGVHLNGGTVPGDTYQICTDVGGAGALANSLVGSGANGGTDFRLRQRQATTVRLPGYAGANNNDAAVVTFVQGRNTGGPSGLTSNTVPTGGGFVGGAACPQP